MTTINPDPSSTTTTTTRIGHVSIGDVELWVDQRGAGPDVVLIAGLTDPAEAWTFQLDGLADRYRVTTFDNRGAGRSPMPPDGFTVMDMADDTAALMRALGIADAHVCGFSGGSLTSQHLALRHPELVRSLVLMSTWARPDAYMERMMTAWTWLPEVSPSERAMLEAFLLWIYTPRAHEEGMVDAFIEEALAFEHPQSAEGFRRQLDAWRVHDSVDRLHEITAPTLVVSGEIDLAAPPRLGKVVADGIPGAEFVVLEGEAHQPFQERPEKFNALVHEFWSKVDTRTS
jgi:pimeloyl-ACP methyl ester carboxylesterase